VPRLKPQAGQLLSSGLNGLHAPQNAHTAGKRNHWAIRLSTARLRANLPPYARTCQGVTRWEVVSWLGR